MDYRQNPDILPPVFDCKQEGDPRLCEQTRVQKEALAGRGLPGWARVWLVSQMSHPSSQGRRMFQLTFIKLGYLNKHTLSTF